MLRPPVRNHDRVLPVRPDHLSTHAPSRSANDGVTGYVADGAESRRLSYLFHNEPGADLADRVCPRQIYDYNSDRGLEHHLVFWKPARKKLGKAYHERAGPRATDPGGHDAQPFEPGALILAG